VGDVDRGGAAVTGGVELRVLNATGHIRADYQFIDP
jgi:hypothetical protein